MHIEAVIFDWVGTLYERDSGLFEFSESVLKNLVSKNYKLGLVTLAVSDSKTRLEEIENTGIKDYFDSIVINNQKTAKEFLKCCLQLNVDPKNTAIVDDITTIGIRAGNEIGAKTFWITNGDRSHLRPSTEIEVPDYKIDNIKGLLKYL